MVVLSMSNTEKPPLDTPKAITEGFLQALLDAADGLNAHLENFPDSLHHVHWVAKDGDKGCIGAAVVLAIIQKRLSKVAARLMKNKLI